MALAVTQAGDKEPPYLPRGWSLEAPVFSGCFQPPMSHKLWGGYLSGYADASANLWLSVFVLYGWTMRLIRREWWSGTKLDIGYFIVTCSNAFSMRPLCGLVGLPLGWDIQAVTCLSLVVEHFHVCLLHSFIFRACH